MEERERERFNVRAQNKNFLAPKTQLGGLLYRHKRVEKRGGGNGGEMKFKFPPKIGLKGR